MAETTKGAATPTTDANVLPTLVHQANDIAAALEKYKSLAATKEDAVYFLNPKGKAAPGYIDSPTDDMTPMNKIFAAIHADRNDYATYQVYRIKTRVPGDIRVDKGEHGMSLTHTLWNYYKAKKGEKVEDGKEVITLADYKKLGKEEQAKYVKSPQRQVRNAFNIDQTDVTQREDYNQIVEKYGNYEDRVDASDRTKDTAKQRMAFNAYVKAVSENMTRIAKASTTETHYDAKKDVINLAAQSNYANYADYTQDVNRQIISATGNAERRGRRGTVSGSNITPSNSDMAREALIVELASAARQLDMGMPANISETNRKYIDTWIEALKSNPNYLVDVEREVSIANKIVEDAAAGIKIERKSDKLSSALLARVPENAKTYSEVQVTQREDGRWCIYFGDKESKQYQAATLAAADTTAYFEQLRHYGQRHEKFLDFKQHLAQAYSAKIANDPSVVAGNIFYDNVEGADVVEKASLYVKDGKTYISPTIAGKRLQAKEITWPQQHRIIISPDRTAALKGLSALMYQNEVKAQQQANQKAEEEKKQQAAKEAEEKKVREAAEKQKKAEAAKAKSETMKAAAFYTVVATLTSDYETRAFDRYMQDSEYDRMLEAAETYGKGRDVDLTAVYNSVPVKHGKVVAFGEDGANVVLYQEGVYTVLKAVSEEDIRAALKKNGLPQDATPLVQTISETIKKEQSEKEQAKTAQQTTMSPIMKQYKELKAKHPEALLLFRCGDFYEAYAEDAHNASKILGLTLSQRNGSSSKEDAIAGFPYHALDTYLPRLIRAGQRVAICDQLEVPKQTKKVKTEKQTTVKVSNGNTESKAQQQTKLDNIRSRVEEKEQELSVHPILYTGEVLRHAEKEDLAAQRPTVYLAGDLHTPHQIMMVSRSADSMDITLDNGKAVKLADLYVVDKVATKEAFRPEISQQMEDTYAHEPVTFDQNGPEFLPRFREDTDQIILEGESKDGGLLQFTYDYDYSHNFETNWDMALDKFEKAYVEYADNKKVAESESLKQGIRFIPNGGSGKWSGIPADLAAHIETPHEKVSGVIVSKFKPTAPKISLPTLSAKVAPTMFTLVYNPFIKQCSIKVAVPDNQKVIDLLNATKNYRPRQIDGTKDYFIEKDTWHDALGALEEITLVESKVEKTETKSEEQTTSRGMHM